MTTKIGIALLAVAVLAIGASSRSEAAGDSSAMSRLAAAEERQAAALERIARGMSEISRACR